MIDTDSNIILTGGGGFLGFHIYNRLIEKGYRNIYIPRSRDLNLVSWDDCWTLVTPDTDAIIHLAADVGGIGYLSKFPGKVMYNNTMMGFQLLEIARRKDIDKFVFVGSSCAYPNITQVPYKEEDLWNGYPDMNTSAYGLSKRMTIELIKKYSLQYGFNGISLISTNLYGERDHFHPEYSHVIPALIKKFIENKDEVTVWGTGKATREFLYAGDAADGIISAMEKYDKPELVNLGTGKETSIKELVEMISALTYFNGKINWDKSKPDGTPRRCMNVTKAEKEFGFVANTLLIEGLKKTIDWYVKNIIGGNKCED